MEIRVFLKGVYDEHNKSKKISMKKVYEKVEAGMPADISDRDLIEYAAQTIASMTPQHPDYGLLAGQVCVAYLHQTTSNSVLDYANKVFSNRDLKTSEAFPLISQETLDIIKAVYSYFDGIMDYGLDYTYDYFAYKTLEKSYLLKDSNGIALERPQNMLLRVAIGIHGDDIANITETYSRMSKKQMTHASPTLFNAGTVSPQMSSCFLMHMKDDSLQGIFDTLAEAAQISKSGSGLAIHIHNIRSKGSVIKGNNGRSAGIVPMLRVFNETARYVDQAGKRKGAFAIYLEPWHADIVDFLDLRKNHGKEEMRARDLFYGLWVPDLFMERVEADGDWTLFDPKTVPNLPDAYGDTFKDLYERYELQVKGTKMKARDLWQKILEAQIETGNPYMLYKDAANLKSNQKNIGTIKSSNLCCEILEVSKPDETAVCNLASISLPSLVKDGEFDFIELMCVTTQAVINMNRVIDRNFYPTPSTLKSNMQHRPVGLGIQGLADVFMMLDIPFESEEAKALNRKIFETMYFAALTTSNMLAKRDGPYATFPGSPASQGILQFDMWDVRPSSNLAWEPLRADIKMYGLRNSLLIALMPTATTGQILGNNECFEPYTSNIYARRVLSGEFVIVNKHLVRKLEELGLWGDKIRQKIIANNGSVQGIKEIPKEVQAVYKTVWEISQKTVIDLAADRGAFVDQSQSMNIFMAEPNFAKLTSMHMYAWKAGLKTGMYYLRTLPKSQAVKFTVEKTDAQNKADMVCSLSDPESCEACGS